jgi:cellulose synthase/poly-beta-1,6-N-acetylglucosamine synthase-like glycosyltransferase/glycosyltransferase involved in cell wall biosynthesis
MNAAVRGFLLAAAVAVFLPMAVWSVECLAALLPRRKRMPSADSPRPRVAVLVPAYNEAPVIGEALTSLAPQILPQDRLVVIADNCTDNTAAIARQAGATVLERQDPAHRGKSYALDYAVRTLAEDAPDVFVVIDADCIAGPEAIDKLARLAAQTGRPVQGCYILEPSPNESPLRRLAALAFRIRNLVRPSGLDRLSLPCLLNGSGMALPARTLSGCAVASGKLTEDWWLTVDLILNGHAPIYCAEAKITSRFPPDKQAEGSQRRRWLQGHIECVLVQGPRLFMGAIRQRRLDLLALLADLLVPPLSLLLVLWLAVLSATSIAGMYGQGWPPAAVAALGGLLMAVSLGGVLLQYGGALRALAAAPLYILSRLPFYASVLLRRDKSWVRTGRDPLPKTIVCCQRHLGQPDSSLVSEITASETAGPNLRCISFDDRPVYFWERKIRKPNLAMARAACQAVRRARREGARLLFIGDAGTGAWCGLASAIFPSPTPFCVFSFNSPELPRGIKRFVMSRALRRIDEIFVHSSIEKTLYSQCFGLPPERFKVRLWGIGKPDLFPAHPLHPQPYYCALGGNGRDYKTLIEASRLLPKIPLVVVAPRASLEGLDVPGHVRVLSDIPFQEAMNVLGYSEFTVLPLASSSMPCGHVTLVCAMHLRKAVIATDSRGISEYVRAGDNGLLCEMSSAEDLARAVRELWNDPETTARLAASNAAFGAAHCHEDVTRAALAELLVRHDLSEQTKKVAQTR